LRLRTSTNVRLASVIGAPRELVAVRHSRNAAETVSNIFMDKNQTVTVAKFRWGGFLWSENLYIQSYIDFFLRIIKK
jgi:hypothetical protein